MITKKEIKQLKKIVNKCKTFFITYEDNKNLSITKKTIIRMAENTVPFLIKYATQLITFPLIFFNCSVEKAV